MKTSLRSFLAAGILVIGFAAASAHAGEGASYWKNRAAAKIADTKTPAASSAKRSGKPAQTAGNACAHSCCGCDKAGS